MCTMEQYTATFKERDTEFNLFSKRCLREHRGQRTRLEMSDSRSLMSADRSACSLRRSLTARDVRRRRDKLRTPSACSSERPQTDCNTVRAAGPSGAARIAATTSSRLSIAVINPSTRCSRVRLSKSRFSARFTMICTPHGGSVSAEISVRSPEKPF